MLKKLPDQRMRFFVPPQHNVYVNLSNLGSTRGLNSPTLFCAFDTGREKIEQRLHSSKEFVTSSAPTTLGAVKDSLYSNLIINKL